MEVKMEKMKMEKMNMKKTKTKIMKNQRMAKTLMEVTQNNKGKKKHLLMKKVLMQRLKKKVLMQRLKKKIIAMNNLPIAHHLLKIQRVLQIQKLPHHHLEKKQNKRKKHPQVVLLNQNLLLKAKLLHLDQHKKTLITLNQSKVHQHRNFQSKKLFKNHNLNLVHQEPKKEVGLNKTLKCLKLNLKSLEETL